MGARLATPTCSSDAIHIHIAIQVFPLLGEAHGGPVSIERIS